MLAFHRVDERAIVTVIMLFLLNHGYAIGMDYQVEYYQEYDRDVVQFMVVAKDSEVCTVLTQDFKMPL